MVSAIAFGGKPDQIIQALLRRRFFHVTSSYLLEETKRNLTGKLGLDGRDVEEFLAAIAEVSTIVEPSGHLKVTGYGPDDLVLETAFSGACSILVTGDKRHLLPLRSYKGIIIEAPALFLDRLREL
jgi:putative PIN family toxin of toxin-antitoxin system